MELTKEILEQNGFINNHPERPLSKYYYSDPNGTYFIIVRNVFKPETNALGWETKAYIIDKDEVIINKVSASFIKTVEKLQSVIDLCDINLLIIGA